MRKFPMPVFMEKYKRQEVLGLVISLTWLTIATKAIKALL